MQAGVIFYMKATINFAREKFDEFNERMFGSELPEVPILMSNARTFMGVLRYERRRNWYGRMECVNFRIYLSTRFDLPQNEVEDTLIHEMIHLYIASKNLKDSSVHGKKFREIMARLNRDYGRNITVSHNGDGNTLATDCHKKAHYICETHWNNGERFITCVTRSKLFEVNDFFKSHRECVGVRWWFSNDPFFNRYPDCRTPKLFQISLEDYNKKVAEATECVCDGKVFQPASVIGK